eukprot:2945939-Pyramimonas_sp.AAC.1
MWRRRAEEGRLVVDERGRWAFMDGAIEAELVTHAWPTGPLRHSPASTKQQCGDKRVSTIGSSCSRVSVMGCLCQAFSNSHHLISRAFQLMRTVELEVLQYLMECVIYE